MKSIWVYMHSPNEYNQEGFYATHYWLEKPTLQEFCKFLYKTKIEDLGTDDILELVSIYKGDEREVDSRTEKFIECMNGEINYNFNF